MNEPTGRVLILLCTYNEVENLPPLVAQLRESLSEADILVVDDGSPDGTGEWVAEARKLDPKLFLIERSGKLGLGTATRDGMAWCITRDYDYLIQMDADFSHRPQDVPRLLDACTETQADVVVGTRYSGGGGFQGVSIHRRWMSWLLNRYAIWLLKLPISDCSGSFRCYRVAHLRSIPLNQLQCVGYGFLEEILATLHAAGGELSEVAIQFDPRSRGSSKLALSDAIGVIHVIHQLAFGRLAS